MDSGNQKRISSNDDTFLPGGDGCQYPRVKIILKISKTCIPLCTGTENTSNANDNQNFAIASRFIFSMMNIPTGKGNTYPATPAGGVG